MSQIIDSTIFKLNVCYAIKYKSIDPTSLTRLLFELPRYSKFEELNCIGVVAENTSTYVRVKINSSDLITINHSDVLAVQELCVDMTPSVDNERKRKINEISSSPQHLQLVYFSHDIDKNCCNIFNRLVYSAPKSIDVVVSLNQSCEITLPLVDPTSKFNAQLVEADEATKTVLFSVACQFEHGQSSRLLRVPSGSIEQLQIRPQMFMFECFADHEVQLETERGTFIGKLQLVPDQQSVKLCNSVAQPEACNVSFDFDIQLIRSIQLLNQATENLSELQKYTEQWQPVDAIMQAYYLNDQPTQEYPTMKFNGDIWFNRFNLTNGDGNGFWYMIDKEWTQPMDVLSIWEPVCKQICNGELPILRTLYSQEQLSKPERYHEFWTREFWGGIIVLTKILLKNKWSPGKIGNNFKHLFTECLDSMLIKYKTYYFERHGSMITKTGDPVFYNYGDFTQLLIDPCLANLSDVSWLLKICICYPEYFRFSDAATVTLSRDLDSFYKRFSKCKNYIQRWLELQNYVWELLNKHVRETPTPLPGAKLTSDAQYLVSMLKRGVKFGDINTQEFWSSMMLQRNMVLFNECISNNLMFNTQKCLEQMMVTCTYFLMGPDFCKLAVSTIENIILYATDDQDQLTCWINKYVRKISFDAEIQNKITQCIQQKYNQSVA